MKSPKGQIERTAGVCVYPTPALSRCVNIIGQTNLMLAVHMAQVAQQPFTDTLSMLCLQLRELWLSPVGPNEFFLPGANSSFGSRDFQWGLVEGNLSEL